VGLTAGCRRTRFAEAVARRIEFTERRARRSASVAAALEPLGAALAIESGLVGEVATRTGGAILIVATEGGFACEVAASLIREGAPWTKRRTLVVTVEPGLVGEVATRTDRAILIVTTEGGLACEVATGLVRECTARARRGALVVTVEPGLVGEVTTRTGGAILIVATEGGLACETAASLIRERAPWTGGWTPLLSLACCFSSRSFK
jgi:hypothetical protein